MAEEGVRGRRGRDEGKILGVKLPSKKNPKKFVCSNVITPCKGVAKPGAMLRE